MPETVPHKTPEGLRLPVLAPEHRSNPLSELYSNPFSDSFFMEFSEARRLGFYSHGVFSPLLETFDDDELCDGGLAAYLFEWSVFRRVVPLVEALHALEFEDDQTLRIPVTLHYLYCATASKVLATIG